jgi:hypothetical protein
MATYHPERSVLRVAGEEAGAFLDALLTNDVSAATAERPVYAALLTPQGKLVADVFAHRADDGALLLDVARKAAADLLRRLTLFRLRRRIDLVDVSPAWTVEIHTDAQLGRTADPRRPDGALGARILAATPAREIAPLGAYEAFRIGAGIPDPAIDAAPEEVFALEALLEELHGVDFQKGCFIGQENVSRMKRRATTRRKFCRLAFEGGAPAYGTPIVAGPVTLGDVRSGIAGCALALLRLDRALEASEAGTPMTAGDKVVHLDPPGWLILPAKGDA